MDEFTIDTDKVQKLRTFQNKIERLYDVRIKVEKASKDKKQWLQVNGEPRDRRNAKEYILAVCHPDEQQHISMTNSESLITADEYEDVEKQTNAVIDVQDETVEIKGTELGVTLAMSSLMDLIDQKGVENDDSINESFQVEKSPGSDLSHPWTQRLDKSLRQALSDQSGGSCNMEDYSQTPAEVKRVLLHCLSAGQEDDDSVIFMGESETFDTNLLFGGDTENTSNVRNGKDTGHGLPVNNLAQQFLNTNISQTDVSTNAAEPPKLSKDQEYLKSFGLSVGYSDSIVDEGMLFIDERTKPSDFLEILRRLKDSKKTEVSSSQDSEQLANVQIIDNSASPARPESPKTNSKFPPPPDVPSMFSPTKTGGRGLPRDYENQLMRDFNEEHENLSVQELKRRNEERQNLLKQAFQDEQQKGCKRDISVTPSHKKNKNKKSRKKKNSGDTPDKARGKPSSSADRFVDLTAENDDDDEETCVMKPWHVNDSESEDECQITDFHPAQHRPVVIQPKQHPQFTEKQHPQFTEKQHPQYTEKQHPQYTEKQHPQYTEKQQFNSRHRAGPPVAGPSRNNQQSLVKQQELRYIVVDASNVAMTHGNGKVFSCRGIKICIDHFLKRGHKQVMAFVPEWRKYRPRHENPISDQDLLNQLKEQGNLVFTPSRRINGRLISSYDDRFVLELAEREDGVIVSNDQYRDLAQEKASWRTIIEDRLLMYTFAGDNFMIPEDPLGKNGPNLDEFLQKTPKHPSPHRKRPLSPDKYDRPASLLDTPPSGFHAPPSGFNAFTGPGILGPPPSLNSQNFPRLPHNNQDYHYNDRGAWRGRGRGGTRQQYPNQRHNNPNQRPRNPNQNKFAALSPRSEEQTKKLFKELKTIFSESDQEQKIWEILRNHSDEEDITRLTNYCMNAFFS